MGTPRRVPRCFAITAPIVPHANQTATTSNSILASPHEEPGRDVITSLPQPRGEFNRFTLHKDRSARPVRCSAWSSVVNRPQYLAFYPPDLVSAETLALFKCRFKVANQI